MTATMSTNTVFTSGGCVASLCCSSRVPGVTLTLILNISANKEVVKRISTSFTTSLVRGGGRSKTVPIFQLISFFFRKVALVSNIRALISLFQIFLLML